MALNKKPVTGMRDIMPAEMQVRDYVLNLIRETYAGFGFNHIETPCMENIGNLTNKQGGENEKLIFKVMKRGEKLKIADATTEEDIADIAEWIGQRDDIKYYLQSFKDSGDIIKDSLNSCSDEELKKMLEIARKRLPCASLRGI